MPNLTKFTVEEASRYNASYSIHFNLPLMTKIPVLQGASLYRHISNRNFGSFRQVIL